MGPRRDELQLLSCASLNCYFQIRVSLGSCLMEGTHQLFSWRSRLEKYWTLGSSHRPDRLQWGSEVPGVSFLLLEWPLQDLTRRIDFAEHFHNSGVDVGWGAYHQNRILISFWMKKRFFCISRDICETAFFPLSVSWLTSNEGQKGDWAVLKNLLLSEAKCICV